MSEFSWPVRIYYEDTDSGGVVYYANYLKFMERTRTEWLRVLGFEQDALLQREGILFAVRAAELDFHKPAFFNDLLRVTAELLAQGRASLTFGHRVLREGDEAVLCAGRVKVACLDGHTLRPRPIPPLLHSEIARAG